MESLFVDANGLRFHVHAWGDASKPVAVLLAGTAFVAETWFPFAEGLSRQYRVYAIDRRGHGASDKPQSGYEFFDFAEDLVAVMDALGITAELAVGHSAGATDILVAATLRPDLFNGLFVHEPTVADPDSELSSVTLPESAISYKDSIRSRRYQFSSRSEAMDHFRVREPYIRWSESALLSQWNAGLQASDDGSFELSLHPERELQVVEPILHAVANIYRADHRGNPFERFKTLNHPIALVQSSDSEPMFNTMIERARNIFPNVMLDLTLSNTRHCAPQENPQGMLAGVEAFAELIASGEQREMVL